MGIRGAAAPQRGLALALQVVVDTGSLRFIRFAHFAWPIAYQEARTVLVEVKGSEAAEPALEITDGAK